MRLIPLLLVFCAQVIASSELTTTTTISIQPLSELSSVSSLAQISYNPLTLTSSLLSYETPELSQSPSLLRIGIFNAADSSWASSVSITLSSSFEKGYSPTILLTLDSEGRVLGVSLKSSAVDAGQTRDFGPKVKVVRTAVGKGPELNKPVLLNPEGKLEEPVVEKTLLQRYWWVGLAVLMLVMTAGGGEA